MNHELRNTSIDDTPEALELQVGGSFLADVRRVDTILRRFCSRGTAGHPEPIDMKSQQLCERVRDARRKLADLVMEADHRNPVISTEQARRRRENLLDGIQMGQDIIFLQEEVTNQEAILLFDSVVAKAGYSNRVQPVRNSIMFAKQECYVQTTTMYPLGSGTLQDTFGRSWRMVIQREVIQENEDNVKLLFKEAEIALFEAFKTAGPYAIISALQPKSDLGRLAQQMILDWHTLPETMTDMDHLREAIGVLKGIKIPIFSTLSLKLVLNNR